jgi:hypothetical protein
MEAVINELKTETRSIIKSLSNQCMDEMTIMYDGWVHGSDKNIRRWVKTKVPIDTIRNSPYWLIRMMQYNYSENVNLHEKVWFDYMNALSEFREPLYNMQIVYLMSNHYKCCDETRQMWKEAEKEKLLMLYEKVPTDVLNEMLSYM